MATVQLKAKHIAVRPSPRAKRYLEAWCRWKTRGAPAYGFALDEPEKDGRLDPDLQLSGVVETVLAEVGGGEALERLLVWIHADGRKLSEFQLLRPGSSWPTEVRELCAAVTPIAWIALVYRLFVERLELAISLYEMELVASKRVWVEIEGRFVPD
jgi:hypothetical protein